ncbi:hypothetical protein [Streptomyces sp. NBC_01803]|uniref:hypothetical protein n=1 Tax=Streptomyces sp. NBC_01803 TaxID=2975946 RepID=UPI002DDC5200|nr:hypothetical protein [Streptomyces sp. NBC_01803]WSA46482.1 hypothetical protein OIE51_21235 [Streptomyces sp. NBC_01803]
MKSSRLTRVAVTAGTSALLVLGVTAGTASARQQVETCEGAAAAGIQYFAIEAGGAKISDGAAFAARQYICTES